MKKNRRQDSPPEMPSGSMRDLKVAAVQMNALLGQTERNLAVHRRYIERAARAGADLVCFPELSVTGHFCHPGSWKHSEPLDGPSVRSLARWSREFGIVVSAGIAERAGPVAFNAQVLVGPDGLIGRQHKIHMSRDEYFYYRGGSEFPVFDIGKARVGICICYDIIHPEVARILALGGAEIILFPHAGRCGAWNDARRRQAKIIREKQELMKMICGSRCYDSVAFGVFCDQTGNAAPDRAEPVAVHAGGILIHDPLGKVLAESRTRRIGAEEMVVAELKAAERARLFPSAKLTQRRTELFGPLLR